jgi:VanZ family protein
VSTGRLSARRPGLRRAALATWLALVFLGSLLPGPNRGPPPRDPLGIAGVDKWLHTLAGAGLTVTLSSVRRPRTPGDVGGVLGLSVLYCGVLELLQTRHPWRTFEAGDVAAAAVGSGLGVVGWWAVAGRDRDDPAADARARDSTEPDGATRP